MDKVKQDCNQMWEAINGLDVNVKAPEYSEWKCNPFYTPCIVADKCYAYRDHLDEEMEESDEENT